MPGEHDRVQVNDAILIVAEVAKFLQGKMVGQPIIALEIEPQRIVLRVQPSYFESFPEYMQFKIQRRDTGNGIIETSYTLASGAVVMSHHVDYAQEGGHAG